MAAGTGGHVFPALSIAQRLLNKGAEVHWLATQTGMENELLKNTSFALHRISVSGLRGSGLKRKVLAPFMLLRALIQSYRVVRTVRPDCVLGMGGFVCGPAGLAANIMRVPVLLHEQNAVAGLTNKLLHKLSHKTFAAFPGSFPEHDKLEVTGNPVRAEIEALHNSQPELRDVGAPLRILILGGSQGAMAINKVVPEVLATWDGEKPHIWHQTGEKNLLATQSAYQSLVPLLASESCRVDAFINDMPGAYAWADVVICRSGASTVSELAVAGLPAILVPYPYHKDQQQLHNANWLVKSDAARLIEQCELTASTLGSILHDLAADPAALLAMRKSARALAKLNVAERIADYCLEYGHDQ